MARLVLDGLELQDIAAGIWFDVVEGDLDSPPTYVGEDDDVIGATGREPGEWIADTRTVVLTGHVWGVGADRAARQAAYRAKVDALIAKANAVNLVDLVAHGTAVMSNFGLAVGQTATLQDLRFQGIKQMPPRGWDGARGFELTYECIHSDPNWEVA